MKGARERNDAARQKQRELREEGIRVSFHAAKKILESEQKAATKAPPKDPDDERVKLKLEQAIPSFLQDGFGLRGPQMPITNLTIDGADGKGTGMQVKPARREAAVAAATENEAGVDVDNLGETGEGVLIEGEDVQVVEAKKLIAGANVTFTVDGESILIDASGSLTFAGFNEDSGANVYIEPPYTTELAKAHFRGLAAKTDGTYGQLISIEEDPGAEGDPNRFIEFDVLWDLQAAGSGGLDLFTANTFLTLKQLNSGSAFAGAIAVFEEAGQFKFQWFYSNTNDSATMIPLVNDITIPGGAVFNVIERESLKGIKHSIEDGEIKSELLLADVDGSSGESIIGNPLFNAGGVAQVRPLINTDGNIGIALAAGGEIDLTYTGPISGTVMVHEDGEALPTAATVLDFVGAIVTATGALGTKTITILPTATYGDLDWDNDAEQFDVRDGTIGSGEIIDDSVTNVELANMAASTIKGRANGGGTGDPQDLTGTQATAILDVFTTADPFVKGLVPAGGTSNQTTEFLRKDATWAVPAGAGGTEMWIHAWVSATENGVPGIQKLRVNILEVLAPDEDMVKTAENVCEDSTEEDWFLIAQTIAEP